MSVILSNDEQFQQELNTHDKVIVKYFATWCGACKLMAPKYKRLSDDERFQGIQFLDVNAEQNEMARKMAGVNNLPFIATFKNGVLQEGLATAKEDQIVSMLENLQQ